MTHVWFGSAAVKSRSSRSPARQPSLPGIVVRTALDRRSPLSPSVLMARSTEAGDATGRLRMIRAIIFRCLQSPSGVGRRTPAIGPSTLTVHGTLRTALITSASLIVRLATCYPALAEAR